MAVQLFLDNQEVIIDSSQEIKITKENPYFTLSDSYTLDVSIPLSILQNRKFFGSLHRIDTSKQYREYSCRLLCANVQVLEGTAHIVQSTDLLVKVQLACGVSALKMSSEQEGTYIDRLGLEKEGVNAAYNSIYLDYGATTGNNHSGYGIILHDDTNDQVVNLATSDFIFGRACPITSECPKLLDVASLIAAKMGYTLDLTYLPEACQSIYVVSATQGSVGKKLPHWTVKEFFTQFQNFFGCTFVRNGNKQLKLVSLSEYINRPEVAIEPISDFQAEYSEDDNAEGIMNRNVEFQMETSDTEVIDSEILEQAEYNAEFTSMGAMENAFRDDSADIKMRKLYKLNGETYIGWEVEEGQYELRKIAPFNPLKRFEDAESVQLKIAPAYIEEDVECIILDSHDLFISPYEHTIRISIPSVSNPYGLSTIWNNIDGQDSKPTLQSLVEGTESIVSEDDKTDTMSVAFIDGREETVTAHSDSYGGKDHNHKIHLAFTDYNFKKQLSNNRSKWSFSLNHLQGYDFYLGQLHQLTFHCSHKVKHIVKFINDTIPDPASIFIIHGKRFACEKIEASIRDAQLDRLMTGYFYEISQENLSSGGSGYGPAHEETWE